MSIFDMWTALTGGELSAWAVMAIILGLSMIQVSPLKLNPWDAIFGWLGKKMTGSIQSDVGDLRKRVRELWINNHRRTILDFARECRGGETHEREEWTYVLQVCEEYEEYCEKNSVQNGIVKESTRYLRELFHDLTKEGKV